MSAAPALAITWEKEISAFEAADRATPPAANALLLTGSSTIGYWPKPHADFAPLPVIHRGFGGSTMADLLHYVPRVILPYRPAQILIYSGENDLGQGLEPATVAATFGAIVAAVRAGLPSTRIWLAGVKPSPVRAPIWDRLRAANVLLQAECARVPGVTFVDFWELMLRPDGSGRTELYLADQLHMNAAGYALWTARLRPLLLAP